MLCYGCHCYRALRLADAFLELAHEEVKDAWDPSAQIGPFDALYFIKKAGQPESPGISKATQVGLIASGARPKDHGLAPSLLRRSASFSFPREAGAFHSSILQGCSWVAAEGSVLNHHHKDHVSHGHGQNSLCVA